MQQPDLTRRHAAELILKTLPSASIPVADAEQEVLFTHDTVFVGMTGNSLAKAIWNAAFPRAQSGVYYHFTSLCSLKEIALSGILRLYNLHKRYSNDEFRTLCRDNDLTGYHDPGSAAPGADFHRELMDHLFYTSLVDDTKKDSALLWDSFGDNGKGVRLALEVHVDHYDGFRRVSYQTPAGLPVLKALQNAFTAYSRRFVVRGLSQMPAYYIAAVFEDECEYRLLVKKPVGDGPFEFPVNVQGSGPVAFIECRIDGTPHSMFLLKLIEVAAGANCDLDEARRYVQANPSLSAVRVMRA